MLRRILLALVVAAVIGCAIFWWLTIPAVIAANSLPAYTPDPANGLTTFNAGGCSSCHAVPGQPDRLKLGGGLAITSPFGTFYSPNISPDPADGIGRWTEAEFVSAVLKGTVAIRRALFPGLSLCVLPACQGRGHPRPVCLPEDAGAGVRQGARSRRAVSVQCQAQLSASGNSCSWTTSRSSPDAARSAQWNRGAYLVNGLGHCAECHSPRNFLGGIVAAQRFAGGPNPEGEGWVPNITQKRLGEWSAKDIAYFLETGQTPDGDTAGGSMARVIRNTSQLSAGGSRGDGGIHQVAAAGGGTAAAEEGGEVIAVAPSATRLLRVAGRGRGAPQQIR